MARAKCLTFLPVWHGSRLSVHGTTEILLGTSGLLIFKSNINEPLLQYLILLCQYIIALFSQQKAVFGEEKFALDELISRYQLHGTRFVKCFDLHWRQ